MLVDRWIWLNMESTGVYACLELERIWALCMSKGCSLKTSKSPLCTKSRISNIKPFDLCSLIQFSIPHTRPTVEADLRYFHCAAANCQLLLRYSSRLVAIVPLPNRVGRTTTLYTTYLSQVPKMRIQSF